MAVSTAPILSNPIPGVLTPGFQSSSTAGPGGVPLTSTGALADPITGKAQLTGQLINDLTTNINSAVTNFGTAAGDTLTATGDLAASAGYTSEAGTYSSAAAIARQNETLAGAAGTIEQAQIGLQVGRTIGSQQAGIASAGFGSGGTALNLMRASQRQGVLEQQLTGVNSTMQQMGYEEQATAATAESQAASTSAATSLTAAAAANSAAATATAVGNATKTNANSMAATLGLNIPGLSGLSATSMPTIDPSNIAALQPTPTGPTMSGGKMVFPGFPNVI